MATKKAPPVQLRPANLTAEAMRDAIPKLKRRIADLEAFDPQTIRQRFDPQVEALDTKLEDTVASIFGTDTVEYDRFQTRGLDTAGLSFGTPIPHRDVLAGLARGKERQLANLRTIIDLFEEKLADAQDDPTGRAKRAFGDIDLHPKIAKECAALFQDGYYSQAVEAACKVLELLVQFESQRTDLTGTNLMRTVFSIKAPILKYNDQQNDSEKSEQEGMMHLFEGAAMALRNPRAHGIINDHPERTVEYLSFLSMLARSLDRTQRT
jgi:uncharacterized protein (TIGR02391 family)